MTKERFIKTFGKDYYLKETRTWYWPFWRVEKVGNLLPKLYCYCNGEFVPAETIRPKELTWVESRMKVPETNEFSKGYVAAMKEVWHEFYGKWMETEDEEDKEESRPVLPPLHPVHSEDDYPDDGEEY